MQSLAYLVGAGSMSIGVENTGFHINEVWETPGYSLNAATWDLNRQDLKHQVVELDANSDHFTKYRNDGIDLLYGNPPCGGLSSMTCSRLESSTNSCMRKWIRMVVKARPRMVLMENAYQLATPRVWPLLSDLAKVLESNGYEWWTWKMYSFQVGTPQVRRRAFLCATLDDIRNPELIELDDIQHKTKDSEPTWPYLWDLHGVKPSSDPVQTREGRTVTQHGYGPVTEALEEFFECLPKFRSYEKTWFTAPKDSEKLREMASSGDKKAEELLKSRPIWEDCPSVFSGISMFRPFAIRAFSCAPAMIGSWKYIHTFENRVLTMREMARLMGYPDDWEFHEYNPSLIAQGIPVNNAKWAADRMARVVGLR